MSSQLFIPEQCREQARWCEELGSPLYAFLLTQCAADYEQGGPVRDLLEPHKSDRKGTALPLRMMGAVHRLALSGTAPELARNYPSCGGEVDLSSAWQAFRNVLVKHMHHLQQLVLRPVQTNEVGRCGALLGGFMEIARRTGLPLRLLEIGASAGLNLRWDHYRYTWRGGAWGPPSSQVSITEVFQRPSAPEPCDVEILERSGCDPDPIDAASPEGRLTLLQYVWADQVQRIRKLESAIEIARAVPCQVEKTRAGDWLPAQLHSGTPGAVTVLFHAVVWQYLPHEEREQVKALIDQTSANAIADAPFAWLRMEPGSAGAEVKLMIAPGFADRTIATAGYHEPKVNWLV
jgi:hypothetical protein